MPLGVYTGITWKRGEILPFEDLTAQLRTPSVDAAIDDSNHDPFTSACFPHFFGLHGIKVPLVITYRICVCWWR